MHIQDAGSPAMSRRHFLAGTASAAGLALAAPALAESLPPAPGLSGPAAPARGPEERPVAVACPACCHPELASRCGLA
ncbi:MAG: hypothetical protein AB7N91_06845 [Candidatus Tectimicrobiota bacterium]